MNALLGSVNTILPIGARTRARARRCAAWARTPPPTAPSSTPPTTPTARRCRAIWPAQWERAPALYEALGWAGAVRPRAGGRRPARRLRERGTRPGGRRGHDPHRRPRPVPVRHRQRSRCCCWAAGARRGRSAWTRPTCAGRYGVEPRAGARLHRPARRPVRRPARRQGHRREARGRHPRAAHGTLEAALEEAESGDGPAQPSLAA